MQIIAHRGVSAHHFENTLESISSALQLDIHGVEVDVHEIKNGFVIFHDFTLERVTSNTKEICSMTIEELSQIRLPNNNKVPTLSELFRVIKGKVPVNLEIKAIRNYQALVDALVDYVYQTHGIVILSSFDHFIVRQLQLCVRQTRIGNHIRFGALIAHLPLNYSQYSVELDADIAAIDAYLVNKKFVEHAHKYDKEVWCYTVNCPEQARRLKNIGVDAIFTNDPELMLNELT